MTKYRQEAGSYRHPITFQIPDPTRNEYGEQQQGWIDFVTVKAGIYPVSGKDYISAVAINSEITHKVNVRYVPGLTPNMRILFGSRKFTVIAILNYQEMNRELQIMCKEFL